MKLGEESMAVPSQPNTSIIDLIKDFEGIIGTLLGVFSGSVITLISQKLGRIYFYLDVWEFNLYKMDGSGREIIVNDVFECRYAKYKLEADCFNNSNVLKGLRNIQVVFEGEDFKYDYTPLDSSTKRPTSQWSTSTDKMELLSIPPKQFVRISLEGKIEDKTELQNLVKYSKVYLKALNHKNKEFKWSIKTASN